MILESELESGTTIYFFYYHSGLNIEGNKPLLSETIIVILKTGVKIVRRD